MEKLETPKKKKKKKKRVINAKTRQEPVDKSATAYQPQWRGVPRRTWPLWCLLSGATKQHGAEEWAWTGGGGDTRFES